MADRIDYQFRGFVDSETSIRGADYSLKLKANGAEIPGGLKGGATDKLIQIFQWELRIESRKEASTGMATGRRVHYGLHCIGPMSKAGPLIFKALVNNETIEAELRSWKQSKGERTNFHTIELGEGRVQSYEVLSSPLDGSMAYDFVIVYHTIVQTWEDGGLTHTDEWHGQGAA